MSNNSFINARTYDGFRKVVAKEFNEIHIIDMKGDARTSGERRQREGGNVFSDQIRVGVAVYFLVKKQGMKGCKIYYNCVDDYMKAAPKKAYLRDNKIEKLPFAHIQPDKHNNWISLAENDWDELIQLATKQTKLTKKKRDEKAIFKLFSLGVVTNRDEWVYDIDSVNLAKKVGFFIDNYNAQVNKLATKSKNNLGNLLDNSIKWTRAVKNDLIKGTRYVYHNDCTIDSLYRPFVKRKLYYRHELNEMQYQNPQMFPDNNSENFIIAVNMGNKNFNAVSSKHLVDLHFNGDSQCFPLYRYDNEGTREENVTGWTLSQFQAKYQDKTITKEAIFHYVYAVLHNPAYRLKYEINLKREFPRIPYYQDFWKWEAWGTKLMYLHSNYETVTPFPLKRIDSKTQVGKPPLTTKAKLKSDKDIGTIELDGITTLNGIPKIAWEYKLGNHSALEWVLEYYKERKPKDPTILQKFNNSILQSR